MAKISDIHPSEQNSPNLMPKLQLGVLQTMLEKQDENWQQIRYWEEAKYDAMKKMLEHQAIILWWVRFWSIGIVIAAILGFVFRILSRI